MKAIFLTTCVLASVVMTGCSTIKGWTGKRDDGSLDYQKSQKLDPIKLPANQVTADFVPLYPTPNTKPASTISLTNQTGKQYELPKPPKLIQP